MRAIDQITGHWGLNSVTSPSPLLGGRGVGQKVFQVLQATQPLSHSQRC